MVIETDFTRLVGCRHPLQQATMGGISGRQLAAPVSNAGGLGMLHSFGPLELQDRCDWMDENATGVWGIGFNALFIAENMEKFELAAERAAVVVLAFAAPDPHLIETIHRGGALAFWQLGSHESAVQAVDAGIDVIVAQGTEAGGHQTGSASLWPLLEEILTDGRITVPVLAAGGITTGRLVAALLSAGAAGVRLGTIFVSCPESDASDAYREALVDAAPGGTIITTAFGAEWPEAPHRVLSSSLEKVAHYELDPLGEYDDGTSRFELPRYSTMAPTRYSTGPHEAMAMYAGTGVGGVDAIRPAAEVVHRIMADAESCLVAGSSLLGPTDG